VTDDDAIALVTSLICQVRLIGPDQVSETGDLVDDLGFDSLDTAELIAALHQATGRQLDFDSVSGRTVRDIARGLASQVSGRAGQ
jgi:acyl carrier protein